MRKETEIERKIMLRIGALPGIRVFKNHVAQAYVGKLVRFDGNIAVLEHAQPIPAGLCEGSADLVGWRVETCKCGTRYARFLSLEIKKPDRNRVSPEQKIWQRIVREAGGIAEVVESPDEAEAVCKRQS